MNRMGQGLEGANVLQQIRRPDTHRGLGQGWWMQAKYSRDVVRGRY